MALASLYSVLFKSFPPLRYHFASNLRSGEEGKSHADGSVDSLGPWTGRGPGHSGLSDCDGDASRRRLQGQAAGFQEIGLSSVRSHAAPAGLRTGGIQSTRQGGGGAADCPLGPAREYSEPRLPRSHAGLAVLAKAGPGPATARAAPGRKRAIAWRSPRAPGIRPTASRPHARASGRIGSCPGSRADGFCRAAHAAATGPSPVEPPGGHCEGLRNPPEERQHDPGPHLRGHGRRDRHCGVRGKLRALQVPDRSNRGDQGRWEGSRGQSQALNTPRRRGSESARRTGRIPLPARLVSEYRRAARRSIASPAALRVTALMRHFPLDTPMAGDIVSPARRLPQRPGGTAENAP